MKWLSWLFKVLGWKSLDSEQYVWHMKKSVSQAEISSFRKFLQVIKPDNNDLIINSHHIGAFPAVKIHTTLKFDGGINSKQELLNCFSQAVGKDWLNLCRLEYKNGLVTVEKFKKVKKR